MKKKESDKVALKLLNQYADGYRRIEQENNMLKLDIIDLKTNLKINKEIIEDFFKCQNTNDNMFYINKLKDEIKQLNITNERLKNELESINRKLGYYEQVTNDNLLHYRESTESLKNKIFILENAQIKKDNHILSLNNKLNRILDREVFNDCLNIEREIYIIDPTTSINLIYDDLLLYKQTYENLIQVVRKDKQSINENNQQIEQLKKEVTKLKELSQSNQSLQTTCSPEDSKNTFPTNSTKKFFHKQTAEKHTTEEWVDILKTLNISAEELDKINKNSTFIKIIDGLELLNRVVIDKNMSISILNTENENLNKKNTSLIEENISLSQVIMEMKLNFKNSEKNKNSYKNEQTNASMQNNISTLENEENKPKNLKFNYNKVKVQSIGELCQRIKNKSNTIKCKTEIHSDDDTFTENVFTKLNIIQKKDSLNFSKDKSESSGHDSIIDLAKLRNSKLNKVPELESCTSSEFRDGMNNKLNGNDQNMSGFISNYTELENIKIEESKR